MTKPDIERIRVERLAYALWEERGRPSVASCEDWYRAEEILGVKRSSIWLPLPAFIVELWPA